MILEKSLNRISTYAFLLYVIKRQWFAGGEVIFQGARFNRVSGKQQTGKKSHEAGRSFLSARITSAATVSMTMFNCQTRL
jgi:trehalose utilization protein